MSAIDVLSEQASETTTLTGSIDWDECYDFIMNLTKEAGKCYVACIKEVEGTIASQLADELQMETQIENEDALEWCNQDQQLELTDDAVVDMLINPEEYHGTNEITLSAIRAAIACIEQQELIQERIWHQKAVETKSCEVDLVTETDQEIEKLLISTIQTNFPDHKFIGEEATAAGGQCELTNDPTWIIDPVDGTMNFVHGYPNVCISVALVINKEAEIGIIYNPVLELFFSARRGRGAYLNEQKIMVSEEKELSKALIGFEFGTSRDPDKMNVVMENMTVLVPEVHGIRSSGSCAQNMAMVALGATDASFEFGIHAWDIAAGDIIVREAGGIVIDPAGGPLDLLSRRYLCANSQEIADQLIHIIQQYYPERD